MSPSVISQSCVLDTLQVAYSQYCDLQERAESFIYIIIK